MRTSRIGVGFRLLFVLAGATVILIGLVARGIEGEYGPPSYTVEQLGGRAVAYDVDDMTSFELEELAGDRARVFEGEDRRIAFEGTSFEAHAWLREQTHTAVYEGTVEEVDAWVAEQRETGKDMLFPNLLIAAGVLIVIAGLALGWQGRRPSVPATGLVPPPLPPGPPRSDPDALPHAEPGVRPSTRVSSGHRH